jgi:hypothetical protein
MEKYAVDWTEWAVHKIMFWETDDERKGRILRTAHHSAVYGLLTMIVVSHTIYPAFWLQTVMLALCGLICIQHMLMNGCVVSKVENRLLKDNTPIVVGPFLEMFRISVPDEAQDGLLTVGSCVVVMLLLLEWVGRLHHKVIPIVQSLVSASVARIPTQLSSP